MHYAIRNLIAEYPEKIRLVHRHYPLDHEFNPIASPQPFHVGSGRLALLAIAAIQQDRFWKMNDYIFQEIRKKTKSFDFTEVAQQTDLDKERLKDAYVSEPALKALEVDIREGLKYKITSTPAFLINDMIYNAVLPTDILQKITTSPKKNR